MAQPRRTEAQGYRLHVSSTSGTGYAGVESVPIGLVPWSGKHLKPFKAVHTGRGGHRVTELGSFDTALEAAVAYARHVRHRPRAGGGGPRRDAVVHEPAHYLQGLSQYLVSLGGGPDLVRGWDCEARLRQNGLTSDGHVDLCFIPPAETKAPCNKFRSKIEVARFFGLAAAANATEPEEPASEPRASRQATAAAAAAEAGEGSSSGGGGGGGGGGQSPEITPNRVTRVTKAVAPEDGKGGALGGKPAATPASEEGGSTAGQGSRKRSKRSINDATLQALQAVGGLGEISAQKINAERCSSGPFASFDELKRRVEGLGKAKMSKIEAAFSCG